jgi:hypothetical protein
LINRLVVFLIPPICRLVLLLALVGLGIKAEDPASPGRKVHGIH